MEQKHVTREKIKTAAKDSKPENLLVHKQEGNTVIRIYGDSVLSEEEQQKALERCKEIG